MESLEPKLENKPKLPEYDQSGQLLQSFLGTDICWRNDRVFAINKPFPRITQSLIVSHEPGSFNEYDPLYECVEKAIRDGKLPIFWLFGEIAAAFTTLADGEFKFKPNFQIINELNRKIRTMAKEIETLAYPGYEYGNEVLRYLSWTNEPIVKALEVLGILIYSDQRTKSHGKVIEMEAFIDIDRQETYSSYRTGSKARKAELATFELLRLLAATMKDPGFGQQHHEAIERQIASCQSEIEAHGSAQSGLLLDGVGEFILGKLRLGADIDNISFWQIGETIGPVYRALIEIGVLNGPEIEIDPSRTDKFIVLFSSI